MNVQDAVKSFIAQSQRVFQVTHKPKKQELQHVALATAMGILIIGVIGYIVSMIATLLRHGY